MKGTGFVVLPKEKIDSRDYLFSAQQSPIVISSYIDVRDQCGLVLDQGNTNSCTGFSRASIADMLWRQDTNTYRFFSPLFLYWNGRASQGWTSKDEGAYIFDVVRESSKIGLTPDRFHPFSKGVFSKPDLWAFSFAKFFSPKSSSYYKITDSNMDESFVDDVKLALHQGYGVIGGVKIFEDFYKPIKGVVSNREVRSFGGHALHWVGYVDLDASTYERALQGLLSFDEIIEQRSSVSTDKGFLIFKNSWGLGYGYSGYAMISYDYVDRNGNDFWAVKK